MALENSYATLVDFLLYLPNSSNANTTLANGALNAASRMIDRYTGRYFFPMIKTNYYDTPKKDHFYLHDDLLEMLTLTNGNGIAFTASEFKLWPYNHFPKSVVYLNPASSTMFEDSTTSWSQASIQAYGIYGYHEHYGQAWGVGSTLAAAITTTTATSCTVTSGTPFAAGQIIKIDSELILITNVSTTTLTIVRGWNGSTAATHLILATITIWTPEADIKQACLIQAARLYKRNDAVFGTVGGGEMGVQPLNLTKLDPDVQVICDAFRSQIP